MSPGLTTLSDLSERTELIQRLLDRAALGENVREELITLASERLVKLTRTMLRNYPRLRRWEQTDDVYQNAVFRLHRSLAEVSPESVRDFFALAATQIRRSLIDLARHHFGPAGLGANYDSHRQHTSTSSAPEHSGAATERPETLEAWAAFHEAAELLPRDEREVFDLVWYQGLSQQDIARLLEISVRTVKRRWHSARILLHEALQGFRPPD
jgi:RNA polymerase sigma factor (sigma-70 family)